VKQLVSMLLASAGEEADEQELLEGLSEYRDTAVPQALLGSASVVQNPDAAVLETLRELNQLLGGSHMRTVNEWLRILTQVGQGGLSFASMMDYIDLCRNSSLAQASHDPAMVKRHLPLA
jgi:hypothetical protein